MLAAFRGEEVVVEPGRSPPVRLNVRPSQEPHPPIWIAVQRREAVPFVARRGLNLALVPYATLGSPEELKPIIDDYRRDLPAGVTGTVSAALHLYVGTHLEPAQLALQRFLDSRRATQSTFYLQKVEADPRHASAEHLAASGLTALGSPGEVRPVLERYRAAGVDEILAIVDFGGLAPYRVAESVTAIGALEL
jgi:alkanesulfonate monooxygenase SsuD/methylene tetrahydromethanopterin reductase-like flavin-dependent oxidoreductase (luciferase family)